MNSRDYYKVLGVDPGADTRQIKEAYRRLAFQYHPDRNRDNPAAAEKMKWINEAYAVLSDPAKRREYDTLRRQFGDAARSRFRQSYSEQDIFSGSDINQIFEQMARTFGFRGFEDIFREFYGQGFQHFEFKRPGFFARGFVFTAPRSGMGVQRRTLFQQVPLGKWSRRLLEKISGMKFPEDGADIHDIITVRPELARSGGPYAYFLRPRNKKLVVHIPPGVRPGQRIRLAGMGAEGRHGGRPGDLYLKVRIRKPLLDTLRETLLKLVKSIEAGKKK